MPHANAASIASAAPSVCPVCGLVDVQGVLLPKTAATARLSILSLWCVPVPCRLIQPMSSGARPACCNAV
ncbi:putative 3-oxoacyl-(Acyl-carrier-) synthase domain protein [Neisseria meningitidis 2004032]|nr:putative 3-oxoacyl-(Acyl-carrier-) synthase domain protein [Neisseria meningitidis 2004032]